VVLNEDTIKGKWMELRGDIQKAWGKLTNDELDKTKGDLTAIGGLIQQRYGEKKEAYSQKLSDIAKRYQVEKDGAVESVKDKLRS